MYLLALIYFDRFVKWWRGAEIKGTGSNPWTPTEKLVIYIAYDLIFGKHGIP